MTTHNMNLDEKWFNKIADNSKKYEARLYDSKRQLVKLNDVIVFACAHKTVKRTVVEIGIFDSWLDALHKTGTEVLLPGISSIEEGLWIYHDIPGYKTGAAQYGVVVFKLASSAELF